MARSFAFFLILGAALPQAGCGYNASIAADERVKAAWANVENVYQRRADLIPNLVATVKGAAAHEEKVLSEVTTARAQATQVRIDAKDLDDPDKLRAFETAQAQLSASLGRLLAVSENYPDLKANASFRDLQAQIEGTENRIAVERRRYNEAVAEYNSIVRQFPTSCGARMAGLKARPTFQATTRGAERAPEVKF
jgi:LemA protein